MNILIEFLLGVGRSPESNPTGNSRVVKTKRDGPLITAYEEPIYKNINGKIYRDDENKWHQDEKGNWNHEDF